MEAEEYADKITRFCDYKNHLPFVVCRDSVVWKGGEYMKDKLMVAGWKISGVESILRQLQTCDMFRDTPEENALYILAEELADVSKLIKEVSNYIE